MKTKIAILTATLSLLFLMIKVSAQSVPEETTPMRPSISSSTPPTFETTTSGLEIKVWVMTQEEHRQMMEGMNDQKNMYNTKDKGDKKMTMSGTHHIKVEITDVASGEARNDLGTKVEVIPPSKKSWWVDLRNMSNHYGNDLTLKEKGPYMFTVRIDDKGVQKTTEFNYTVQ